MEQPPAKRPAIIGPGDGHRAVHAKDGSCCDGNAVAKLDVEAVRVELVCTICLDLPSQVATVLPCLHSFCWSCIAEWFKGHHRCPRCAQTASSARPNPALNNLVQAVLEADPSLGKPADLIEQEAQKYRDYRLNRSVTAVLYPNSADVLEDEEDDSDIEDEERLHYWPCPCCIPGNRSGYVCPAPIPTPPGAMRLVFPPARGGLWPDLGGEANALVSAEAMEQHRECQGCSSWLPRDGLPESKCTGCEAYNCSPYDSQGACPKSTQFQSLVQHHSSAAVSSALSYSHMHATETERVRSYMLSNSISVHDILDEMTSRAEALVAKRTLSRDTTTEGTGGVGDNVGSVPISQVKAEAAACLTLGCEPEGTAACHPFDVDRAEAVLGGIYCKSCMKSASCRLIEWWWIDVKTNKKDSLPEEIRRMPDCWYGNRCRLQDCEPSHAAKYNHLCQQTVFPQPGTGEEAID